MTKIYLIRHAEAEGNLYRVYQGQRDTLVTEQGKAQVHALGERFRSIHVDAVYSSDLYRAAATAAGICRVKGLPLHREAALREICVGEWEGRPVGAVAREQREWSEAMRNGADAKSRAGAESSQEVTERMLAALRKIAADHDGETVAVVSHGAAISYAVREILKDFPELAKAASIGGNTSITELEVENGEFRIVGVNDSSHLDEGMEKLLGRPYRKRATALEPGLWYIVPEGAEREEWLRAALELGAGEACSAYAEDEILVGVREEERVGVVALRPEADRDGGWIDILWVKPELRCRSYGIQLLGQAVFRCRALGREHLRIAVGEENTAAKEFLSHYGFAEVDVQTVDGCVTLEKDIAVRPLEI